MNCWMSFLETKYIFSKYRKKMFSLFYASDREKRFQLMVRVIALWCIFWALKLTYWEIVWVQFILMIPQLTKDAHSSTTERYIWNDSTKFAVGLLFQIVLSTIDIRSVTRELARVNIVVWMFKVNSELYYGTEINSWLQIECTLRSINLNYFSTNFYTWIN